MDLGNHGNVFSAPESHPLAVQKSETISLHVHPTSKYVTACDEFYMYDPHPVLVLQAGVRRPGYEPSLPCVSTASWSEKAWV